LFAQNNPDIKRTMHWYFGYGAGLDFTSGSPVIDTTGKSAGPEQCFTMSDTCGNLLFYGADDEFNGTFIIWTKNHTIMQNGILTSCMNPTQTVCVPQPGNDSIYYVFYSHLGGSLIGKFLYAIININHNGGFGEVISANNILIDSMSTEKAGATKHCNGTDYWIAGKLIGNFTPVGNQLFVWQLSSSGLNPTPVVSAPGNIGWENGDGYFRFSPDGSMAAVAYICQASIYKQDSSYVEIYKFDNCTGIFSNPVTIQFPQPNGLSFSPDNTKLYAGIGDGIGTGEVDTAHAFFKQYDLTIYNQDSVLSSAVILQKGAIGGHFQIALDGKIYVNYYDTTLQNDGANKLGVILNPNYAGLACNYLPKQIVVGDTNSWCSLGLPYWPDSYFNSFNYQNCENNIQEIAYESLVKIYPNPASDLINIQCRSSGNIKIYNTTGKLCLEKNITDENTIIDIRSLSSGLYVIQFYQNKNQSFINQKIIKL